jgi:hypothetical protein
MVVILHLYFHVTDVIILTLLNYECNNSNFG